MIHIFLSYAKADESSVEPLFKHLKTLERNGTISLFSAKNILAGDDTDVSIEQHLQSTDIFLACLSADYNSDADYQKLLEKANSYASSLRIIPVLLRPCDWENGIWTKKEPLPKSRKFLYEKTGNYIDENCTELIQELKLLLATISPTNAEIIPNSYTLNSSLLDPTDNNMLYGRRDDYEKLCAAMKINKIVNIKGIAGIGKTTLVQFYLSQAEVQKRFPIIHNIVLADSRKVEELFSTVQEKDDYVMKNLQEALVLYFANKISYENADEKTKFQLILNYIRPNAHQTLFVFDNADELIYANRILSFLNKINCQILISSRNHIQNCTEIPIEKVALPAAQKMFAAYNNTHYPTEKVAQLLHNIDCHTLLIELCAKQLKENATINIDTLIEDTAVHNLSNLSAKDIVLSDNTVIETELYKFILYLFKPATLSDAEQQILRYFSLLRNIPYPLHKLEEWFIHSEDSTWNEAIPQILLSLSQKGWLQRYIYFDIDTEKVNYQCHLIVSYAIRHLLEPSLDNCNAFLNNIEKEGRYDKTEHIIYRSVYLADLLYINYYFPIENQRIAEIQMSISNFYESLGEYQNALNYNLQALKINKKVLGKEHLDIANNYNNIGGLYCNMGDYPQALAYYQEAITINEKVLGKEHPDTAITYNNIGGVYNYIGDYMQALVYCQIALSICEKVLGKEHLHTASAYNNIGFIYKNMNDYSQALVYFQQALIIKEKVLEKEHPDLTNVYNNIGLIYRNTKDYLQALNYFHKSLTIREKVLGKEHPYTAGSYNNIGLVYNNMGDNMKALYYYQQALSIYEKVLGKEHPHTAVTYYNISWVYEELTNYKEAWKYINWAIKIIKKKLPENHQYNIITKDVKERIKQKMR